MSCSLVRNLALGSVFALAVSAFGATGQAHAQSACVPGPGDQPETGLQGQVPNSVRVGPDGFRGFKCGMNKVGQNVLYNRGIYGATAIWGRCAYSSTSSARGSVTTMPISSPTQKITMPSAKASASSAPAQRCTPT